MKTLLVPFYDDEIAQVALATACLLGESRNAYVEGLFVLRPPQIFDGEGIALAGSYLTQLKDEGRRLADIAREQFEKRMAEREVPLGDVGTPGDTLNAGWTEMEGLEGQVVGDYARLFDLVVIGRGFGQPWIDWNVMCEAALFESGRPVMVTPESIPESVGRNVVVAWNCSTETARTVAMARPLLESAETVTVLSVSGWGVPGPSGEQLAEHLKRNGIAASARSADPGGRSDGETVLEESAALGADLLVKGAYTHSRLRQLVFGGATRHILSNAELPVFLAH